MFPPSWACANDDELLIGVRLLASCCSVCCTRKCFRYFSTLFLVFFFASPSVFRLQGAKTLCRKWKIPSKMSFDIARMQHVSTVRAIDLFAGQWDWRWGTKLEAFFSVQWHMLAIFTLARHRAVLVLFTILCFFSFTECLPHEVQEERRKGEHRLSCYF